MDPVLLVRYDSSMQKQLQGPQVSPPKVEVSLERAKPKRPQRSLATRLRALWYPTKRSLNGNAQHFPCPPPPSSTQNISSIAVSTARIIDNYPLSICCFEYSHFGTTASAASAGSRISDDDR